MTLKPIGVIRSPYAERKDAPRQGFLSDQTATLELAPEYAEGLLGLKPHSQILVLYWADRAERDVLQTKTPFGPEIKGVFVCRSPARPNPISLCVAEVVAIDKHLVRVKGLDALDGSPLLDIKPQISADHPNAAVDR